MGLFDNLAGAVLSNVGGKKSAMVQVAMDLFNQNGGLEGVVEKFKAGGLAEQAASWVSTGENIPISVAQVAQVLGNDTVAGVATKLGMDADEISRKIAEYLPQVIDKMTPKGEVNAKSSNLMSAILSMTK
ncbi:MAG: DUF937 domain-containing protein [Betaproteobacteria bacterium]|nr:DUF937 domain-containing protein [Betaproteobacteria bacterium]